MQVKLLDYGVPSEMQPKRAHANDVGADVYALKDRIIEVGCSAVIGLGFGLDLPAGFGAFIFPRSSQTAKGVDCKLPPLDPGYTGEMHAVIHNGGHEAYHIYRGDRMRLQAWVTLTLSQLPAFARRCKAVFGRQAESSAT